MFDHFERDITYLRISVTDKCNLRCSYCMPPEGVTIRRHEDLLSLEQLTEAARAAVGLGVRKVRLTGGEPLVRRGVVDLVRMIAAIDGLEHLGLTTNGTLLAPRVHELAAAGLDSVNVSLDTLDPIRYAEITRGGTIGDALAGIHAARSAGLPLKINMVVLDDVSARETESMRAFCSSVGARLQLINRFDLTRGKGDSHAFDRPPSCAGCNRIRLLADGTLKPCLHSDDEIRLDPRAHAREPAGSDCCKAAPRRRLFEPLDAADRRMRMELSHLDEQGAARMVDVSAKDRVRRTARAAGKILMQAETLRLLREGLLKKGDAFAAARIAGIAAAKRTSELIPLCHNIRIDHVGVDLSLQEDGVLIEASAVCTESTGIEMEALTAVAVAALTLYDMCKAADKGMSIADIHLVEKTKAEK